MKEVSTITDHSMEDVESSTETYEMNDASTQTVQETSRKFKFFSK